MQILAKLLQEKLFTIMRSVVLGQEPLSTLKARSTLSSKEHDEEDAFPVNIEYKSFMSNIENIENRSSTSNTANRGDNLME